MCIFDFDADKGRKNMRRTAHNARGPLNSQFYVEKTYEDLQGFHQKVGVFVEPLAKKIKILAHWVESQIM